MPDHERVDLDEFFALFDSIVRRPPAFHDNRLLKLLAVLGLRRPVPGEGDRPLPIITFSGPRDVRLTVVHALVGHYEKRTPYADITPSALDGRTPSERLRALLERACDELGRGDSGSTPPPRFPLTTFLLWLCEERELRKVLEQKDREAAMRRRIKARGRTALLPQKDRDAQKDRDRDRDGERTAVDSVFDYVDRTLGAWLAGAAVLGASAGHFISLLAGLAVLVATMGAWFIFTARNTRDWAGRRRFRWFYQDKRRQPYLSQDVTSFERFTLRVVEAAHSGDPGRLEQLDRLLVHAFLEDLRQAYRRTRLRRVPWTRTGYALLTLYPPDYSPEYGRGADDDDEGPGDPTGTGVRFLRLVHDVRAETRQLDPLLVINALPDSPVADGQDEYHLHGGLAPRTTDIDQAVHEYNRWLHDAWLGPCAAPYSSCYLRIEIPHTERDLARDRIRSRAPLPKPPLAARRGVYWVLVGLVIALSAGYVWQNARLEQARQAEASRYCRKPDIVRTEHGECVGVGNGYLFHPTLKPILDRIEAENRRVERAGRPYITLVYLGVMSVRQGRPELLAGSYGELVGLHLQQLTQNRSQPLHLRLLLGNVGEYSAYAGRVARDVVRLSAADPTIVGVVGLGQSVEQTQAAIKELSRVGLPMVGTVNTYDDTALFGRWRSPYYFRVAPSNDRQAAAAVRWAKEVGLPGPDGRPVRAAKAAVFYDATPTDLYSGNLADDFAEHFGKGATKFAYEGEIELQRAVDAACKAGYDLYYYAGRAPQLNAFLDDLERSCGTRTLYVMAGDEVTRQVIDDPDAIRERPSVRFYYTPLAFRDLWDLGWVRDRIQPPRFFTQFDALRQALAKETRPGDPPSEGHAMLAYDAALAFVQAAQLASQGGAPTSGMVLYELRNINVNGRRLSGATGLIDFGTSPDRHDPEGKPVLLVYVDPEQGAKLTHVCGRITEDPALTRRCPGLPQEGDPAREAA
jgi:ABC-type branched-chain amino acid transport systems, periplasmic component